MLSILYMYSRTWLFDKFPREVRFEGVLNNSGQFSGPVGSQQGTAQDKRTFKIGLI